MRKLIVAATFLALGACDDPKASDGYRFEKKEYESTHLDVSIVLHKSQSALQEEAKRRGVDKWFEVQAFSILRGHENCTIHMIDPAVKYAPEYIGHEFTHCMFGRWHES